MSANLPDMPYSSDQFTELLTLKKTSEMLKVHPNTLRQWDRKGILKAVRFGDRKDRHYKKEDVLRLLDSKNAPFDLGNDNDHIVESYLSRKTLAEESLDRLSSIQNITSALSRSITQDEVIEVFLSHILGALGAKRVILFKLNPDTKRLICIGQVGFSKEYINQAETLSPTAHTLYFDVLKSGEPVVLQDYEYIEASILGRKKHLQAGESFACIPIGTGSKVLASMGVYFNEDRSPLNKEDLSFILTVARQFALSLERSYFYEQERQARAEAEQTQQLLTKIHSSFVKFLIPLTPEEAHRTVVDEALKLVGADYGSLFLNVKNKVEKIYSTFPLLYKVGSRPEGYGNTALRTNQILVNQISKNEYHQLLVKIGIRTIIYVPMSYENKTIGLITLNFLTKREPTVKEVSVLTLFGSLASLVIERTNQTTQKE